MGALDAYDLSGRVAVVTGAGSGIGRATAELLAGVGAAVTCADRNGEGAAATAAGIAAAGGSATAVELDVTDGAAVHAAVGSVAERHGRLDVMANIAGIMQESLVVDTTEADLDRVWSINFKGVFFGCQAAARIMGPAGRGSIINMASGAIDYPAARLVCYATAKAAVAQLTRTLAVELGPTGVRVNAVAPGYIVTAMTDRRFLGPDGRVDEEQRGAGHAAMAGRAVLGRVGAASEMAHAVLHLASDASSFTTGQVLRPNGGVSMG